MEKKAYYGVLKEFKIEGNNLKMRKIRKNEEREKNGKKEDNKRTNI